MCVLFWIPSFVLPMKKYFVNKTQCMVILVAKLDQPWWSDEKHLFLALPPQCYNINYHFKPYIQNSFIYFHNYFRNKKSQKL